jgi:autotransporter-associated beta strand protein
VANVSSGSVTGITMTSPGTGYTSAPTVTLFGGGYSSAATLGTPTLASNVSGGLTKQGVGTLTLTGANTYTNLTTVKEGTLELGAGYTSATGGYVVTNGVTLDVSAFSPFTLSTNQSLSGGGTINGSIATSTGVSIYPGTESPTIGTVGTLTFNSDLDLSGGGTAYFDVTTNGGSGNDQISVGGNLTMNGGVLHINALSGSANLDTNTDYVLFNDTYSPSISSLPVLVWDGTKPANYNHYSLAQSGNNVVLHYSTTAFPVVTSVAFSPATAIHGQNVIIAATIYPGSGTINPSTGVTINLTALGGSSTYSLVQSNSSSVYTNTYTIINSTAPGSQILTVTVTDSTPLSGSADGTLTIIANNETWDGLGSDNQWATGLNWSSSMSPGNGDEVIFAGTTQTTPDMESSYSLGSVTFTNGAGAFDITNSANTLTIISGGMTNLSANGQTLDVPVSLAGQPTFNAAAGNLTLNYPVADDGHGVIFAGANTTTLAGVNTYTGNTTIGAGTLAITGTGSLNSGSYGGNLTDNGTLYYNSSAAQTLSGTLSGTGSLVHNGNNTLTLSGANTGYSGVITVNSAGTLLAGANASLGTGTNILMGGTLGASVDNLSLNGSKLLVPSGTNGLVNMTSQMRLPALYGSGTLAINVNNAYAVSDNHPGDSLSACVNFYGTLNITGNVAGAEINCYVNGGSFDASLQNATVNLITGAGGGVSMVGVDNSGGNDVYIGAINVDAASSLGGSAYAGTLTYHIGALNGFSDIEGAVTGYGALVKYGTGTVLLNNSGNTYNGKTTVSAGTLLVNGQITVSPVTVTSGGILSGVGILGGAVTNSAGALLIPGTNSIGTLTFNNNLTLNATSTNRFVVTTAGGASNSVLVTTGTFTPNASVIEINTAGAANLGAGTNVLFNYSGSTLANAFNLIPVFDTAQTGLATNAYIYDTGSAIELVVTNAAVLISSDASLSNLVVSSSEALSPAFNPSITNYTATNYNANTTVTVLVTNNSALATNVLYLNGVPQATNAYTLSDTVPVGVGNTNQIIVVVTAQDGLTTSTNTVTVTRLASANALLSNLVITPAGTLSPTFASGTTNYNATNTYANKSVTVTATSADGTAVLALSFNNGSSYSIPLTTMVASGSQTLVLPTNTVAVRAVSQDLSQTNIYTVNVLLQPSLTVPHLTNSVSGNNLVLSWPADHLGYRLLVQTNNLNKGVSGNTNDWGTVAGTTTLLSTNIAIIKTGVTNEYYKLIYP